MSDLLSHQGGILKGTSDRRIASILTYKNDVGGKPEEIPQGVKIPNVRHLEASSEICLRKWVHQIIERNGTPEELLLTALQRVAEHHTEERLLEAQSIINELGRTGKHVELFNKHIGPEQIQSLLRKGR